MLCFYCYEEWMEHGSDMKRWHLMSAAVTVQAGYAICRLHYQPPSAAHRVPDPNVSEIQFDPSGLDTLTGTRPKRKRRRDGEQDEDDEGFPLKRSW